MITPEAVRMQQELLFLDMGGFTILTGEEETLVSVSLPAVEIMIADATRKRITVGGASQVMRNFEFWIFVQHIQKASSMALRRAALKAVEPYLESVPLFFDSRPRLERGSGGFVFYADALRDSGPIANPYKGEEFAMAIFTQEVRLA